jgi:hypothetical protein
VGKKETTRSDNKATATIEETSTKMVFFLDIEY